MPTKTKESDSENIYNLEPFFELTHDILCIAGFDGYFKRINPALTDLLGYSEAELFAKPINEFIHPDDKEITSKYRESIRNGRALMNFENRYVKKNGEIVWLSWTSIPVFSEKLVYAIAKNITHKKKLDDDRNTLLSNLTRINQDLKQLTYTTSHDLRSPVNNLIAIFSLLDISKVTDPETVEILNLLKLSTESLNDTLNSYVDSLIQKDNISVQIEELDLSNTLNTVLHALNSILDNSKTTINIDFTKAETVRFNQTYLESIFLNLITNSIKYCKPESFPSISISSKKIPGATQLIFSDDGLGFDMDRVKDKIFGFTQKFHNHTNAKGIGLYLIYNHITSLGGRIEVDSRINEGATFTITFKDR